MTSPHEAFREEAYELLTDLESSLLELEENPADLELVGAVFRAMHTIKGSGAMFGFDDISSFTHDVETVYDLVRNGELGVTGELVSLSLAARDQIKAMLDAACGGEACGRARTEELRTAFRALIPAKEAEPATEPASATVEKPADVRQRTYRIRFLPNREIALSGTNPLCLLNELRELGKCQVIAQMDDVPPLAELDPERTYAYWDVILTTGEELDAIKDVFIFVEDDCRIQIDLIDDEELLGTDSSYKKLGDILIERGDLTPEALQEVLRQQKRVGEMLVEAKVVSPSKVASALAEQQQVKEIRSRQQQKQQGAGDAASIRVPADRLDRLVDLVGEMVTIQSRLSQTALGREDAELISIAEEVERLTAELRDNTLNIRMLPIGTTFSKFKRLVRDLSQELGKEIELTTAGADTELDKTVIEKLNDPLVHIIRNSIDHGIEAPEKRETAGKKRQGTIRLAAIHSGDSVIIEIADDGAGLNEEAIRRKAVEKGLIGEQEQLSRHELFQLIFAAGFSTAQKVTGVSGRGVGMDVVKRAIESLRGSIDIDSVAGQGTTIRVRIPLTLAIIDSLLVAIGEDCYVIPLSIVEECIELTRADVAASHGRNLVRVRDRLVPYVHLRDEFAIAGPPPEIEQVVITAVNGNQVGFVVDHVIGEHQTVIKSLGRMYRDVQGLSGATILGDGKVALILDIPQLIQRAEQLA
ncbi:MAG: chemotaxis protein CheA [Trichloromonas sp.]|jgi:two-component system chemotaxis sensor kinase CheA|nr:chemotaxis protein CheA [Trichloromonas sp.]